MVREGFAVVPFYCQPNLTNAFLNIHFAQFFSAQSEDGAANHRPPSSRHRPNLLEEGQVPVGRLQRGFHEDQNGFQVQCSTLGL